MDPTVKQDQTPSNAAPILLQSIPLSYAPRTDRPEETFAGGIFFAWMALAIWMIFALGTGALFSQVLGLATVIVAVPFAFVGALLACLWITKWDRRVHTRNSQGVLIGGWSFLAMAAVGGIWALFLL